MGENPQALSGSLEGVRVWVGLPLLLAAVAVVYGLSLSALPLSRAEAMYALIPREMLASGDWLTPTLQGLPYLDKPPLLYWLNGALYALGGSREETLRLLNLLLAMGEITLTWVLGRHLMGERAALLGAGVLAGSLGFYALHLQLLPDHLVSFFLLGALLFWLRWLAAPTRLNRLGFFGCLAGGCFSKGLIGLVFPVAIVGLTAVAAGRREGLRLLWSPLGWLLAVLPVAGWLVLMERLHSGAAWHFLINEQGLRFLGAREPLDITSFTLPGFLVLTGLWLLPWTPLLPAAVAQAWRAAKVGPQRQAALLLLSWSGVILGFYSLSGCRVEYYSLPALPALALLVGWRLEGELALSRSPLLGLSLLVLAGLALLSGLALPSLEEVLTANRREFAGLSATLLPLVPWLMGAVTALALAGAWLGRRRPPVAAIFLGAVAFLLLPMSFQALRFLSPYVSDRLPGEWLKAHACPGDLLVMEMVEEYEYAASLAWYAGRRVHIVVRDGLPRHPRPVPPEAGYLLTPEGLREWWEDSRRVWVMVDATAAPREPWETAVPAATFPGRHLYVNRLRGDGCRG